MTQPRRVMMIGLDPSVVRYDNWPGVTPEKLEAGQRRDEAALRAQGHGAAICFVDHGETAEATVAKVLATTPPDHVMIGARMRTDPDEFLLFERFVTLVHAQVPQARRCFDTGPTDSKDAVARWT